MPLVPLQRLLGKARSDGYAVGYFEAWDACSLEAVLTAAEEESAPVILGFGAMMVDGTWLDSGGVELLGAIGRSYAATKLRRRRPAVQRGPHPRPGHAWHRRGLQRGDDRHALLATGQKRSSR